MKKILFLLMMFCSLSAFATDYSGKLDVTVNDSTTTTDSQNVAATVDNGTVTLVISDFWYGWIPCGDITVTAACVNGTISNPVTVNIAGFPISNATISGNVSDSNCTIHLTLTSGSDNVTIDYQGKNR